MTAECEVDGCKSDGLPYTVVGRAVHYAVGFDGTQQHVALTSTSLGPFPEHVQLCPEHSLNRLGVAAVNTTS